MPEDLQPWYETVPDFQNEAMWEKMARDWFPAEGDPSESGLMDLSLVKDDDGDDSLLIGSRFGTLPVKDGVAQRYNRIDSEDGEFCRTYTFFDDAEPTLLMWERTKNNNPYKRGRALRVDGTWIPVRSYERFIAGYLRYKVEDEQKILISITLFIFNTETKNEVMRVTVTRTVDE